MSSTNKTTNYNLSQFIGSDKPAWLVDYNGDMSAIDTQMKANADAATAAQTKANTADSKADTNAGAISTLDTQINGASGIAADLATLQGSVNTINSLIGNGSPTTSDQTVIGAINAIEAAVATSEDGDNLANSYSAGEQFMRGGTLYEALGTLTAGTAVASLVLNTDYKVSDPVVSQIGTLENNKLDKSAANNWVSKTADIIMRNDFVTNTLHCRYNPAIGYAQVGGTFTAPATIDADGWITIAKLPFTTMLGICWANVTAEVVSNPIERNGSITVVSNEIVVQMYITTTDAGKQFTLDEVALNGVS